MTKPAVDPNVAHRSVSSGPVELSLIIPLYDEADNVPDLVERIVGFLASHSAPAEAIFVDDGSEDETAKRLRPHVLENPHLTLVRLRRNSGKGAALDAGIRESRGGTIVTLDGDLQEDPDEIPALLEALNGGLDVVCGYRRKRRDPVTKTVPSRLYNFGIRLATGLPLHDINCGLRAFRREVADAIDLYGGNYRLFPLRAHARGFQVGERVVTHRPRRHGRSKYGAWRFGRGFLDLLTALFLIRFHERPAHFFGGIGLVFSAGGLGICSFITYLRLATGSIQSRYPLLALGVLLLLAGFQFVTTGFLAELIVARSNRDRRSYSVLEVCRAEPPSDDG